MHFVRNTEEHDIIKAGYIQDITFPQAHGMSPLTKATCMYSIVQYKQWSSGSQVLWHIPSPSVQIISFPIIHCTTTSTVFARKSDECTVSIIKEEHTLWRQLYFYSKLVCEKRVKSDPHCLSEPRGYSHGRRLPWHSWYQL